MKLHGMLIVAAVVIIAGCTSAQQDGSTDKPENETHTHEENETQTHTHGDENKTSSSPEESENNTKESDSSNEDMIDSQEDNNDTSSSNEDSGNTVITYTNSGFSPSTVTIEAGETVVWESETGNMWVASDQHPSHTEYSGTSRTEHCQNGDQTSSAFDQCSAGDSFSFTFEQTGEWSYHNHENSFQGGTVVVK